MKSVTPSLRSRALFSAVAFLTSLSWAQAQTAATSAPAKPASGDEMAAPPVVLSPYAVTSDNDTGYMSRNTISGTGTNETLMKIPQTIQIANQELIMDLAQDDPMAAIEMTAGSAVRRSYNPGDDTFIWGFRLQSNLKDSLPYTTNAIGTLYDVDRIEVIKGPAAMMFGQNSYTGGVINYVTKQATKVPKYDVRLSFGSFGYRSLAIDASGPITKKFRYRLNAGAADSRFGPRDFGQIKDRFIGGGLEYDISPTTKVVADLSYGENNSVRPKTIIDPVTGQLLAKPDNYTIILPWQTYPITQTRGRVVLTSALSDRLNSRTFVGYNNGTNNWLRDLVSSINPTAHTLAKTASRFDTTAHYFSLGQDFVLRFDTGPVNNKLLFGGDQRNDTTQQTSYTYTLSSTTFDYLNPVYNVTATQNAGTPTPVSISSRTSGAYVQEQASLLQDRLTLLAGMRFNDFFQKSGAFSGFSGTATVSQGSKVISRFGAIARPFGDDVSFYYNRAQSFLFNGGVDYLNNPFKPSVGINNEAGVKTQFLDGALSLSVAYFDINLTNVRVVFTEGPGDPQPGTSNAKQDGEQTNKGFDIAASASKQFEAGALNFTATVYKGDTKNETGVKPAAAVNNTYSLLASYGVKKGVLKDLKFGAGYLYKGERFIATASGYPTSLIIRLPAYNVTRAFLSYTKGRYSLQFNVENLFNKIYVQGAESAVWVQTDPGRQFKTTLSYRY